VVNDAKGWGGRPWTVERRKEGGRKEGAGVLNKRNALHLWEDALLACPSFGRMKGGRMEGSSPALLRPGQGR
jgi:hypothetical protein